MQPISQNNPNVHKGPTSSKEFNELRNNIHYDLVQLFDLANKHDKEIRKNMDVLIRENMFLQNRINELEDAVGKIGQDLLYREEGLNKQRFVKSFYDLAGVSDGDPNKEALIDTMYGYLSVAPNDFVSKISYKGEEGEVTIPESFEVQIFETNNTEPIDENTGMREYYSIHDNEVLRAFDRNKNSFWVHTSSFPEDSGVSEVGGIVHIKLPLDTINNVYANTITMNPSPEYSMTIKDIQVKGYGEQWYRLDNYPTMEEGGEEKPVSLEDSGKLIFSFPKTEITEIQIFFSQPYWFANEKKRDFTYGFQEIEVEYRSYSDLEAEVVTEFSLEETTKRFYTIEEPEVELVKGTEENVGELISHRLYYNRDLTNEFNFGNEIMADIQKVYVKTTIRGQGDTIPMVRRIKLDYSYKDINEE